MYPLDDIFQEAWQIALSAYTTRVFCIPPARASLTDAGLLHVYHSLEPPPPEVIQKKAELFGKGSPSFSEYDRLWEEWLKKFHKLGEEMKSLYVPQDLAISSRMIRLMPSREGYTDAAELMAAFNNHHQPDLPGLAIPL